MTRLYMVIKEHKNFLPEKEFLTLRDTMQARQFPWYLTKYVVDTIKNDKDNFQFVHLFYNHASNSDHFHILTPIIEILNPLVVIRIKANLLTRTNKHKEHGMHVDFTTKHANVRTGIYYVDTNNGYTKFKNGKIIKSEANKYIEFDSKLYHTGATCTNESTRTVINFNYIKQ